MKKKGKVYVAPWEKAFDSVLSPLEDFIHRETTSAILLMVCAVLALILANSGWNESYHHLLKSYFSVGFENFSLSMSIHHWINDGLMAMFFFVVGLELKREILVGELSDPKQALLPIIAAIGGMTVPALIYVMINPEGHTLDGWGIPMATDIAFALGALALLGKRIPRNLLTFLVALAIVDDLGAVIVIALFYTASLDWAALGLAFVVLGGLISFNLGGIRHSFPYIFFGLILWLAMLKSGVHATLAGVLLAFTIPMRPKYDPQRFLERANELVNRIQDAYEKEKSILKNDRMRSRLMALSEGVHKVQAPAQAMEHKMHLPAAYIIIPVFALANAGVPIEWATLGDTLSHSVSLGIIAGLTVGKLIGVSFFSWLAVRLGYCQLPKGLNFNHIVGVGFMGGIGFTMSIFISELGFAHHPEDLLMAKTGVLFASLIAGVSGYLWLLLTSKKQNPPQSSVRVEAQE
ncbi:MAG: Na+/H+ antiporter NhaA [Candidatus Nitrohelix vancouverensis]|uniref:Na(+)/H(+) antiporter NhaA n=1 Tax=Candidatus Nitrohelix vancouverensis TaxID=2705534 RepID=A0A7T0G4E6_9BACT|nr:MAG: Na+/H+ antiporter NhaA [Candidatus Nitrohelix vancouverensis]